MKRYLIAVCVLIATFVVCVLVVPAMAFGQEDRNGTADGVQACDQAQTQLQTRECVQDREQTCTQEQLAEHQRLREQEQLQTQKQSTVPSAEQVQDREQLREQDRTAPQDGEDGTVQAHVRTNEQDGASEQVEQDAEEHTSLPGLLQQWTARFMERLKSWFWRG